MNDTKPMRLNLQELRTVTLAQALERADAERKLVSQTEWDELTRQAVQAARQRGVQRVGVADVLSERAAGVVERAAGRDATVAALRHAGRSHRARQHLFRAAQSGVAPVCKTEKRENERSLRPRRHLV